MAVAGGVDCDTDYSVGVVSDTGCGGVVACDTSRVVLIVGILAVVLLLALLAVVCWLGY